MEVCMEPEQLFVNKKPKKSILHRLVSNMIVTVVSKENLDFYVSLGTNQQEGISFQQFIQLFDAMEKACSRSTLHFKKQELLEEYIFPGHIIKTCYKNGDDAIWQFRKIKSRLLFQSESENASLKFTMVETNACEPPCQKTFESHITERWIFVHKNQIRYEFLKQVIGKTKEDACMQQPRFLVRMFIENLPEMVSIGDFTEYLLEKSFEIFGHGIKPSLIHCPLRHKSRKHSTNDSS